MNFLSFLCHIENIKKNIKRRTSMYRWYENIFVSIFSACVFSGKFGINDKYLFTYVFMNVAREKI